MFTSGKERGRLSNFFQIGWFLWRSLEAAPDGEESNAKRNACDDKILMVMARGEPDKPVNAQSHTEERGHIPVPLLLIEAFQREFLIVVLVLTFFIIIEAL